MRTTLSRYFFNGVIILLPLLITIYLLVAFFNFIDGILGPFISALVGHSIPGLGFIITVAFIFATGYLGTRIIGKKIINYGEQLLYKVPLIKSIYSSVKQINDVLFLKKESSTFRRVCLVEYPRKGIYTVGFATAEAAEEIAKKTGEKAVSIFVPNTPTPATGFLIIVPTKDVILLDMRPDEAFKLIVSGGVLKPSYTPKERPTSS